MPLLLFYIYVLRFQDTWKGFAPFLLIGYRPQGSLLIYVPDKSPRQAVSFSTGVLLHIWMGARVAARNPKILGKWTLPAMDLGYASMVLYPRT